ncbi:hypothetical protein D557_3190 [Bordetella holmesii 70147]|nr:hypothetical protein D557_3190 [Bordetella holmesii 70147]
MGKAGGQRRRMRPRLRQTTAAMISGSLLAQALLPVSVAAQGIPTLGPTRPSPQEASAAEDRSWEHRLAAQAQSLAQA